MHVEQYVLCQSALFNFQSLLLVILLMICTCAYIRAVAPRLIDRNKEGCVKIQNSALTVIYADYFMLYRLLGLFWMSARIGSSTLLPYALNCHQYGTVNFRRETITLCFSGVCCNGYHNIGSMNLHHSSNAVHHGGGIHHNNSCQHSFMTDQSKATAYGLHIPKIPLPAGCFYNQWSTHHINPEQHVST